MTEQNRQLARLYMSALPCKVKEIQIEWMMCLDRQGFSNYYLYSS